MTNNHTMAEMLRAPTEGCAEAIVVPPILAEQFELKHSLINMMTSEQFLGLEKDNLHDHIRWGSPPMVKEKQEKNKIETKLDKNGKRGKARQCQRPITVKKAEKRKKYKFKGPNMQILEVVFIQEQRQGLILQFDQRCTTRGETAKGLKLCYKGTRHAVLAMCAIIPPSLDAIRSSLKLSCDQTSNPTSSTNTTLKGRIRRSSKQKVENSNFEENLLPVATMADNHTMAEMLRAPTEGCAEAILLPSILAEQFELKHSLINMMTSDQFFGLEKDNPHDHISDQDSLNAAAGGNLLEKSPQDALTIIENKSKVRNSRSKPIASQVKACDVNSSSEIAKLTHAVNQQTSVVTIAMTAMLKQLQATPPPAPVKAVEEICVTCEGLGSLPSNTVANPKGELKAITNRSGLVTDGPTVPTPPKSVTLEVGERVEETYTDPDLAEYTIKVPPPPALVLMPKYQKMLKALLSNKEKLQELANTPLNENCSAVILKKLPEKLGDPVKFLILYGFSELKCKALADLGASINLMPLSVWKELGLHELIPTRMTLELANRAIFTPDGIARDVFVLVGKFTFLADFVIIYYESDPRVPLILGRPFLRTARALIGVHGEEMILCDADERLTLNMKHDTASYSNNPHRESVNLINIFNVSSEDFLEVLVSNKPSGNPTFSLHQELTSSEVTCDIHDSEGCNDIHPHVDDNPLSGSTAYSSNSLLEEFTDELALITYPSDYDDNLQFDIESDLKEIEFLLYQGKDSSLKDSIDQTDLANLDDYFVDPIPEMFTDEHAPDYSSPSIFNVYDDDFLEVESDADNVYDDPFDSKEEKIKEIFSRVDALPSTNNEDNVFKPGILIHENPVKIITRVFQEKKLALSYASLVLEDFDPPFYEPLFFKDVPKLKMLLLFSSENEEKVFKPGIYTSGK
nr:reverse transcriptase domain-containing protein [Tanacetum cinerariifolium]